MSGFVSLRSKLRMSSFCKMSKKVKLTNKQKRYIVRQYVFAKSGSEALSKASRTKPDECWVDEKWLEEQTKQMGFNTK